MTGLTSTAENSVKNRAVITLRGVYSQLSFAPPRVLLSFKGIVHPNCVLQRFPTVCATELWGPAGYNYAFLPGEASAFRGRMCYCSYFLRIRDTSASKALREITI